MNVFTGRIWLAFTLSLVAAFDLYAVPLDAVDSGVRKVEKPVSRFIALAPHLVETLFDLGLGDSIVGAIEHSDYPTAANRIPRVGNFASVDYEKIISLKPSLILVWKNGNPPEVIERLQQLGFPLFMSEPLVLDDIAKEMLLLGEATGKQARALTLANNFRRRLNAIKRRYQAKPNLRVFYELWPQPLTSVAAGTWPHNVVAICQVDNTFANAEAAFPQVSVEQVLAKSPEIIISAKGKPSFFDRGQQGNVRLIPAVVHKQHLRFDDKRLHRMTARALDAVAALCQEIDATRTYYQRLKILRPLKNDTK